MIISKLQQFIIFNCDQSEITIPSSLNSKISKIIKVSQPTGSSLPTYDPDAPFPQFNKLSPNTIYLVTSKEGQLGYEIIGAVDPLVYCLNPNVSVQSYSRDFLIFKKDGEEIVLEVENSSMTIAAKYLVAKANKGYKAYNEPWGFYLDNIKFVENIPSGFYNPKASTIQQQLNITQESYINVFFDLSLFDKIENRGFFACDSLLVWDCYKDSDVQTNKSYLMGYCSGNCPQGFYKTIDEIGFKEVCRPLTIYDSDSDSDFDIDSDFDDSLDSDNNEDDYLYRDSDSDSDDYLELDLSDVIFDPILFDFTKSFEYNLNLLELIPDDPANIYLPPLTDAEIINILLQDPKIINEERQYLIDELERILNG